MTRAVCADECIGHAGVQTGEWSVHEVRVVHVGMHGHLCRPVSAASEELDSAADAGLKHRLGRVCEFSMFANGSLLELAAVPLGRRPEAFAAEFLG